ncbi:MAG: hypothetical protein KDJ75_08985 [Alphaproteobacteria bacterium]|nr:hypothetical protein [Alphaproteobacteria bacterium]
MLTVKASSLKALPFSPYSSEDPKIVRTTRAGLVHLLPQLDQGFLRAVVFPRQNISKFNKAVSAIAWDDVKHLHGENFFIHTDTKEIKSYNRSYKMLAPDGKIDGPDILTQEIHDLATLLRTSAKKAFPNLTILLLVYPPGTDNGIYPELHTDTLTVHTTLRGDGGLNYISEDLSPAQEKFLSEDPQSPSDLKKRRDMDLFTRLKTFPIGDRVFFDTQLYHCSNSHIQTHGQIAIAVYPPALF